MWTMNSRGIIHENSLLRMNVIPLSIHKKFEGLLKFVGNMTPMGVWLSIYWNGPMEQVVDYFNRNGSKNQQAARYFHPIKTEVEMEKVGPTNKVEVETVKPVNDEEWDEEIINEIQGIL